MGLIGGHGLIHVGLLLQVWYLGDRVVTGLDETWMLWAVRVARRSPVAPFGAVIVDSHRNDVVSEGFNETDMSPLWHGEIVAIRNIPGADIADSKRLTLYTTAEPCVMCQAAIQWSGIGRVVYGVSVPELVDLGWKQFTMRAADVAAAWPHHVCRIEGPVLTDECRELFSRR